MSCHDNSTATQKSRLWSNLNRPRGCNIERKKADPLKSALQTSAFIHFRNTKSSLWRQGSIPSGEADDKGETQVVSGVLGMFQVASSVVVTWVVPFVKVH